MSRPRDFGWHGQGARKNRISPPYRWFVVQALGLTNQLQSLFVLQVQSLQQWSKASGPNVKAPARTSHRAEPAMKKLRVFYEGWGGWPLATLADGRHLLFEYSAEALQGWFRPGTASGAPACGGFRAQMRLPGLAVIPDSWGLMLMDRLFRSGRAAGIAPWSTWHSSAPNHECVDVRARRPVGPVWRGCKAVGAGTAGPGGDRRQGHRALKALALMGGSPMGRGPAVLVFTTHTGHARQPTVCRRRGVAGQVPGAGGGKVCASKPLRRFGALRLWVGHSGHPLLRPGPKT